VDIYNLLKKESTSIQQIFIYCDIFTDFSEARYLWRNLDYRDTTSWVYAGLFTGRGIFNLGYQLYSYTTRVIQVVDEVVNA
jgi:hypothetical protein